MKENENGRREKLQNCTILCVFMVLTFTNKKQLENRVFKINSKLIFIHELLYNWRNALAAKEIQFNQRKRIMEGKTYKIVL